MERGFGTTIVGRGPLPMGMRWPHPGRPLLVVLGLLLLATAVRTEIRTSRVQATIAASLAERVDFEVLGGKNPAGPPPALGPFDERLGYTRLAESISRLESAGYRVTAQARPTARAERLAALGIPAVFHEKTRAGLRVVDRNGAMLSQALHPSRAFASFDDIPRTMVDTLLFIENRELLAPGFRHRSPVIEWPRLAHAAWLQLLPRGDARRPGGSTLAVQLEKYRHSPGGMTTSAGEKLRQIAAATLRSYHDGPDTVKVRRRIVADYINTVPLAARAGFGEVHGIPDGLAAWFGVGFEATARALEEGPPEARALAFRRTLALFLAQRRPSHYLRAGRDDLEALVDSYLPRLADAGVIGPDLHRAAADTRVGFLDGKPGMGRGGFVEHKAVDAARNELVRQLGLSGTYDLDRMDLTVATTLDAEAQARVNAVLADLRDPAGLGARLRQPRLVEFGDPAEVVYSFLLYERRGNANLLRVQADTLEQPFNVNEGMKLDLGSTAKLRTLVHYLELVSDAFDTHAGKTRAELAATAVHPRDGLSLFVVQALRAQPHLDLDDLIDLALDRPISARPSRFYTGGGSHRFGNYEPDFDASFVSLRTALRHSVNLPFVRLMREIVGHLSFRPGGPGGQSLDDRSDPRRKPLLERFAERESLQFLNGFVPRYRDRSPAEREAELARRSRPGPFRLSVVYRWLHPDGETADLHRFLSRQLPGKRFEGDDVRRWHRQAGPRLRLADRAFLTGLHPIELWLVRHWNAHPGADARELEVASAPTRRDAYAWLFRGRRRAQDLRIRAELERDAFAEIHAAWARTGYPFETLVPSLATAIGSSADRPAALAQLLGILQNDGLRLASRRIDEIRLAADTPYEARLEAQDAKPERVLRSEVARAVRAALVDVVENGTARRARGALRAPNGEPFSIGAKTGTGDDRRKRFASDGRLLSAEVVSRSATLAFLVGDRHFGVLTAYVEGPAAEGYGFTSSLPAQALRYLAPAIEPLLQPIPKRGMQALRKPAAPSPPPQPTHVASLP
ncbi:MAG: transglycosylase domain-containing protein [Deltaproteobacteria bacterium]|nr:transglycosylase domain-containing protein [Deltaproteobacteria bacterium]